MYRQELVVVLQVLLLAESAALPRFRIALCNTEGWPLWSVMPFVANLAKKEGFFGSQLSNAFELDLTHSNTGLNKDKASSASMTWFMGRTTADNFIPGRIASEEVDEPPVVGIYGCQSSPVCKVIASLAVPFKIPMVAPAAQSAELSNKAFYPYFSRVYPSADGIAVALAKLSIFCGWRYVVVVYAEDTFSIGIATSFRDTMISYDPAAVIIREPVPAFGNQLPSFDNATFDAIVSGTYAEIAKKVASATPEPRIFLLVSSDFSINFLLREFDKVGLLGHPNVWMHRNCGELPSLWAERYQGTRAEENLQYDWAGLDVRWRGSICATPLFHGPLFHSDKWHKFWTSITQEKLIAAGMPSYLVNVDNITAEHFESLDVLMEGFSKLYYPFLFDAMALFIHAIGDLLANGTIPDQVRGDKLKEAILGVQFEGLSGPVTLTASGDRLGLYMIGNYQRRWTNNSEPFTQVGIYDSSTDNLTVGDVMFADGTLNVPPDKQPPCTAGTAYEETARQCVACTQGRYSPKLDSIEPN